MNDTRYKNLYDALTSHIDYCNFLETYGKDFVTFENTNFDLLQTIYGGFLLTLLMDTYFKKQSDKPIKCELIPEAVKKLVSMIAEYNGKGYSIGNLHYHDEYAVLEKLRNKLAHGDFIIKDGNIIIEEKNIEGSIKVDDFIAFISSFELSCELNTLYTPYTRIFNSCRDKSKLIQINNEEDFDYVCKNIYRIEITDRPIFPRTRDAIYCQMRMYLYDFITERLEAGVDPLKIEQMIKKREKLLTDAGIYIDYNITKLTRLESYSNIKEKYMYELELHKQLHYTDQVNIINNLAYRVSKNQYQNFNIRKGIMLNFNIQRVLKEHPDYTLGHVLENTPKLRRNYLYDLDNAIISSYLVAFNSIFEYGLEKGLTQKGNYNLVSIFEGQALDFSKLDLSKLDDPNMLIEHTFDKYKTDVYDYGTTTINKEDKTVEFENKKLEQYIKNCKNKDQEKIQKFEESIEDAKAHRISKIAYILELIDSLDDFDLDKYTRNINIITHIRNAIAHGNVYIDCYATDINNTEVIFKDYLEGQIVYEKKIKMIDFLTMFMSDNIGLLYNFFTYNITDKTLIDENFYKDIITRYCLREDSELENDIKQKIKHD